MATYWVSSVNGDDANNASTKLLAKASVQNSVDGLLDLVTLSAGDVVLIDSAHSETWAAITTLDWISAAASKINPIEVISIDWTTEAYNRGASLEVTGTSNDLTISGDGVVFHGINFTAVDNLQLSGSAEYRRFSDCRFSSDDIYLGTADTGMRYDNDCRFTTTRTSSPFSISGDSCVRVSDSIFSAVNLDSADKFVYITYNGMDIVFVGCDFSACPVGSFCAPAATATVNFVLKRCKLHANTTKVFSSFPTSHEVRGVWENCFSGTDTDPVQWIHRLETAQGTVASDDARNRTDGASDGTTSYCWEIVPEGTNNTGAPLRLEPIVKYVAAGSQSVVIYVASGVTLNDDDVWIEVESPSEASPADAQAKWRTTKPAPLVAATALTTDAVSTWSGVGVGTKQKISVTIAPTVAGVVKITPFVATTSTLYIDPLVG